MRSKLLINDVHLGVQRTGGTTIASAAAIRSYLLNSFDKLISEHTDKDLVVNGDLFDTFQVSMTDLFDTYRSLVTWLLNSAKRGLLTRLFLGRGNHDAAKDSSKLSSFDFLGLLLKAQFPDRVVVVDTPQVIDVGIYMIPHLANQELFNHALENVPEGTKILLLHANYDNHFTVESDHSLNVSPEQARVLVDRGISLVFGHEHQARTELNGGVIVTGNQWSSSVADCLNNPDGQKAAHIICAAYDLTPLNTWQADDDFCDIDWRILDDAPAGARFIRVSGNANATEAADVVSTIAKFRKSCDAFIVTNAVKVEGVGDVDELAQSMEDVKGFDVMGFLMEQLDPDQGAVVTRLIKEAA